MDSSLVGEPRLRQFAPGFSLLVRGYRHVKIPRSPFWHVQAGGRRSDYRPCEGGQNFIQVGPQGVGRPPFQKLHGAARAGAGAPGGQGYEGGTSACR
jgi:hypothetical protein